MKIRNMLGALVVALAMVVFGAGVAQDMAGQGGVSVAESEQFGPYLTDSQGNALYVFVRNDVEAGTETMSEGLRENVAECTGGCLEAWPPVTADGEVMAEGEGIQTDFLYTSMIGENNQVVYNGYPLYTFANDAQPGDTSGHGIQGNNGTWYLLSPEGNPIPADGAMNDGG